MRTIIGKVTDVEYFDTSRNGNSRYMAHVDGVEVFTGVDSCLGSAIKNYAGKTVKLEARIIRGKLTIDSRVEIVPDHPHAAFYRGEFANIYASMKYVPTIKIFGDTGATTKHLSITLAQLRAIEAVLLDPILAEVQK